MPGTGPQSHAAARISRVPFAVSLAENEHIVDHLDSLLKIGSVDANDDVKLTGALVDHSDVDVCVGKSRKHTGSSTLDGLHAASYDCDEGKTVDDLEMIGLYHLYKALGELLALTVKLAGIHNNADRVDTGGHVLRENIVVLEDLEQLAQEALVAVHSVLLDGDYGEVLLASDTSDDVFACRSVPGRNDERACVLGRVGVLYVDRYIGASYREDSVLVEHACAHVGKLAQLGIGDNADSLGILNDTGEAVTWSEHS